ncbi:hypothetical protein LAZ67_16001927 [Cordylochernes scorpioides]|uniref:RNA-directed DNA polymerase n=1 Tax=Cordylochernes scorpioides TaxID=51811 RepID=A0ABY6LCG2_9ARAC|nr:hypothetical protein LAZ67_16001927 [Cordylochernes scorpioides]
MKMSPLTVISTDLHSAFDNVDQPPSCALSAYLLLPWDTFSFSKRRPMLPLRSMETLPIHSECTEGFGRVCGNPITHPLPRLPSTFHLGITTEPVKVDRITEDSRMQRMTKAEDEYVADALTNMQPHCEDRVSRLKDAMRGLAAPRSEQVIIAPIDISCATNIFPICSNRQTRVIEKSWHCPANQHRRCPMATIAKSDHQASSQPTPQDPFKTSIWMVETRSGKMQDSAHERIKAEESAKPQPGATIGRDASSDPVVLNPNIDIPKYDGTEDPRPWIESLEEIGFLYHWADYIISRYAAMNMIGSAKTWLNLHKISFTSWENLKSRLIEDFASDANKEEMRMRLNRMQQWNEPAIWFAEDILVLCNKVDPQMEEETKINWVIGELKKEYSFVLQLNPPKYTNELLEICKKLDLFEKNYQERVEKSKALYNGPRSPRPHHQEQWKNAPSFRRPYQDTSKPQAPAPRYYQNTSKPQAPTPRYYQNKPLPQVSAPRRSYTPNPEPKPVYPSKTYNKSPNSNRNRTEDGRPICFKCNKPGHVARYCRVRFVRIVEEDPIVTQDKVEEEIRRDNGTEKSRPLLYADAKHRIDTEGAKPIKHKPYRVSAKEREIIKEQIDEMLRDGIIRPSSSPWSFAVILVKKRDGKYRFCVDYRKLNDVTVKDVYPIPRIDEVLDTLQGSKYFSAIDLKSGYWQVEVEEKDKEKTAFTTAHGLYEFNVMPFGLCRPLLHLRGTWKICLLRPYLYGRHFKIVTDHHALYWLKNLKDPTGRLARWALKIQEYNFEIIHKLGKKHLDADGLSRGPLPENEWDGDYERLFLNQIIDEKEDFIENIKDNLSANKRSITKNFKEENGCLYKKNPNPEGRAWLLVVTKKRRKEIMSEYHNHMLNGHLGVARTTYRLKNKYYWPSMLKDVSEFVKTCHLCQSRKGSNHLPSGLLQPIPPANYPFERIGINFVGPLPSTKRRRKWIIVLTDYYTKYAETKAVSEATVKEVSTFLIEHIILRHGAPRFLISDRGSQFISTSMKEVMKITLVNMISMYVNTDQKNWDEILPFITHAYNTTIQETTGYSPFFLFFGREPMSLLDDKNIPTDSNMDDYDEYIENYLDKIARTRQVVINNTEKTQEGMKRNYDKKHNEKIYEPGHLVAVWTPVRKIGKCEKLLRKYFGPYRILKKLSNVNYLIEPKDNPGQDPLIVHVSRLKPYFERIDENFISRLQAILARFVWGLDALRGFPAAFWHVLCPSVAWGYWKSAPNFSSPASMGFRLLEELESSSSWVLPRRRRLLELWEQASSILGLSHRVVPTPTLLNLPLVGACRFLPTPSLRAPTRWVGVRVRDMAGLDPPLNTRTTRSVHEDAAALGSFCQRLLTDNAWSDYQESISGAGRLWSTCPPPVYPSYLSFADTVADIAMRLDLHALLHPEHLASSQPVCIACGSIDLSLAHRYWSCCAVRPVIREAFFIIGQPPDLQSWIFSVDLERLRHHHLLGGEVRDLRILRRSLNA